MAKITYLPASRGMSDREFLRKRKALAKKKSNDYIWNKIRAYQAELIEKQTSAEIKFSFLLDDLGIKYVPQKIFKTAVKNPKTGVHIFFIVDFFLPDYNAAVEIDGKYHDKEEQKKADATRTKHLLASTSLKKLIRYTNDRIIDISPGDLAKCLQSQLCPFGSDIPKFGVVFEGYKKGDKKFSGITYIDLEKWRNKRNRKNKKIRSRVKAAKKSDARKAKKKKYFNNLEETAKKQLAANSRRINS